MHGDIALKPSPEFRRRFAALCLAGVMSGTAGAATLRKPIVFAPGVISGPMHDTAPAFTPDGGTVYFSRSTSKISGILVAHRVARGWSRPVIAPFSGEWNDQEPSLSPDGRFLIFVSNRPIAIGGPPLDGTFNGKVQPGQGGNLWRVDRTSHGWTPAVHLDAGINASPSTYAPAISADGSLTFMRPDENTKRFRLFHAEYVDGRYRTPEPLSFSTGADTDVDPAIAPDETFIVFGSSRKPARGIDLFIAFRHDGDWGVPIHLGDVVNSEGSDAEPRLGPDGTTLYFSSERTAESPTQPRDRTTTRRALDGTDSWNNGLYNIWTTSLRPWVDCMRTAGDEGARNACGPPG